MNIRSITTTFIAGIMVIIISGCGSKQVKKTQAPIQPNIVAQEEKVPEATEQYTVVKGDSLWRISGKQEIYADSFQWPLIYKANRDQIEDPDLIYPDQDFVISRNFDSKEIQQAIRMAKKTPTYKPHTKPRKRLPIEY